MKDTDVTVLIGAGSMGLAIARRVSQGQHILLADLSEKNIQRAQRQLTEAGFDVSTTRVDVSSKDSVQALVQAATTQGSITKVIHATGISPSHAPTKKILEVDLYGAALVLDEFGKVIAPRGSAVVIGSQASHRMPALTPEQDKQLATTPVDELLNLPMLQPETISDSLYAYQLSKRGCSLRVKSEAVRWGRRGARVNTISPGIVITPLAHAELSGPNGDNYRHMIQACPTGRAGTPDEVASLAALLMGPDGGFITGSDFLMDGGVTSAFFYGELNTLSPH